MRVGEGPGGFSIDRECELRSPLEEKALVRYQRHNLDSDPGPGGGAAEVRQAVLVRTA